MTPEDYPALFHSADESSVAAQSSYLWLIRLQYGLLITAATVALWFDNAPALLLVYAFIVGASTALLIYMSVKKPEKDWYGCRALAESIKTSTWRYMMRSEPFEDVPQVSSVKQKFAAFLKGILDANSHVRDSISRRPKMGDQITPKMNEIRALPLEERREFYRTKRILEQRNWYVRKVKTNRRHFLGWIAFCILIQGSAIVLALIRSRYTEGWSIWPAEPLLVVASAAIGWIQIKKFNELASAYSLTAHEIGIIQTRISDVTSESEFSEFVNESERAFSREHTQWVARQND
ncbi:DUF4231 domain-containing protein [Limoniibacter endophyticus]|uniref:Membrane protein n=1 Tax=Limoniibacter endophyticus TaxID=1565040 RepID=A0A8J3DH35_9HYPH|nr:DUF4231 domain-containing protein [Limoniibacter endophyticus]GHC70960.1 membrane protein [Limoniibacter endophyticus]